MTDLVNVGKNALNVIKSDVHIPYTKVIVVVGTEVVDDETVVKQYEAGTDDGLALEFNCPWGTQDMADKLLAKINPVGGEMLAYKPYEVTSGLLDPAAEIGDAVNTNAVFGGLYVQESTFGHGFYSDYSAPEDEQMNHEYKYESKEERRITRQENDTKAQFKLKQDQIDAKVEQTGGQASSFGWELKSTGFVLKSNNVEVFKCNSSGLTVTGDGTFTGIITAKEGRIGANSSGTGGFIIKSNYITSNEDKTTYDDSSNNGVFIGTSGIGLGKGAFTVSSTGALTATNATITGAITCSSISFENGVTINGSNITNGTVGDSKISDVGGSKVGSGINGGNINTGSIPKNRNNSSVQTTLTNADNDHTTIGKLFSSSGYVDDIYSTSAHLGKSSSGSVYIYGQKCSWKSYNTGSGYIYYLGYT